MKLEEKYAQQQQQRPPRDPDRQAGIVYEEWLDKRMDRWMVEWMTMFAHAKGDNADVLNLADTPLFVTMMIIFANTATCNEYVHTL